MQVSFISIFSVSFKHKQFYVTLINSEGEGGNN